MLLLSDKTSLNKLKKCSFIKRTSIAIKISPIKSTQFNGISNLQIIMSQDASIVLILTVIKTAATETMTTKRSVLPWKTSIAKYVRINVILLCIKTTITLEKVKLFR